MRDNDLQEYIGMLTDMENNIYLQKTLIQELKKYSMVLGKPEEITKPTTPIKNIKHSTEGYFKAVSVNVLIGIFFLGLRASLIGSANSFCVFLGNFLGIVGILWFIILLALIPKMRETRLENEREEEKYAMDMDNYERALKKYEEDVFNDRKRIRKEKEERAYIDSEIRVVEIRIKEGTERLNEMYDLGIVYPKYRNIVMINSIYEYLKSGRCTTLEGSTGAYNLLENEMRLDMIILQLDQVIEQLDRIKQNQYMLYSAIEKSNELVYKMTQSTKEISRKLDYLHKKNQDYTQQLQNLQESSSVSAYNLERINKELHYMNRMKYYAGEYNGTLYNQLP